MTASRSRRAAPLAALLLLAVPAAARAHAHLVRAEPKVGSTVAAAPARVRVWFDDALDPRGSSLAVRGSGGARVDDGAPRLDPSSARVLEVGLRPLAPGTYHVAWIAVAKDGHRTEGRFEFTVR